MYHSISEIKRKTDMMQKKIIEVEQAIKRGAPKSHIQFLIEDLQAMARDIAFDRDFSTITL